MNLKDFALVGIGGAFGSALRYLAGRIMGPQADASIPWHTLAVNVIGSFLIGLVLVTAARQGWAGWWRPLIGVGILGGFTTFSTLALEVVEFGMRGSHLLAWGYAAGSLALGVGGCALGIVVGRAI